MTQPNEFTTFVRQCNKAKSEEQLFALLDESTHRLGFDQFAMIHQVDWQAPPEDAIRLVSFSSDWVETVIEQRYYLDDPVHAASAKTAVGFLWSDVGKLIKLTERQKEIFVTARKFGLADGFAVPVHVPGEYRGTCSFGARSLERLVPNALPQAQLIGLFVFEAARRIMRARLPSQSINQMPDLTCRQLDCVTLVAMGKSDWEIGQILGISQATAHQHVEAARKSYGVSKRTQLVVRALSDGLISFSSLRN